MKVNGYADKKTTSYQISQIKLMCQGIISQSKTIVHERQNLTQSVILVPSTSKERQKNCQNTKRLQYQTVP